MSSEHQQLFSDYAAGKISADDFRRLNELLERDQALRTEFLEYMNTCAFLEDAASFSESLFPDAKIDSMPEQTESTNSKILQFPTWAITAAACAAIAIFVWSTSQTSPTDAVSTRVIASHDAQSDHDFTIGTEVMLNDIDLSSGWVRLELPRGVIFDIYGPASGHFENDTRFRLDSGRLNVDVGPNGKGFTVVTANAEIVDLGTQFGIDVDEGFDAKVAVFSGEVEVHSIDRQTSPRLLVEGEGMQVTATGQASRLMSIDIPDESDSNPPRFSRSLQFDIRDNLTTDKNLRYYGIMNGGMREGAKVYTTHGPVKWRSLDDQPFPAALTGADLIQTFTTDRNEDNLQIDLSVKAASTVFVMFDARYDPPTWLVEKFTETGDKLISGPWKPVAVVHDILPDSQGDFYINYHVWKAELNAHEKIMLGTPVNSKAREDLRAMYGIAVKTKLLGLTAPVAASHD